MKKVVSFTLAVVLAFSFLLGSAFASSGVAVVAPDTFISWGSFGDLTTLAVPSDAVSDGNKYIIYQVRDWVVSYWRVRFVIDSFTRGDPVEGEALSWTRYTGEWGLGVNAALEPSSYEMEYHAGEEYTYSKNFLHLPVKSNFDYYDADGELIISGSGYVNNFEGLMDLTLNDGTVIQVPRRLVGNQFVVVRSASNSNQYKVWNFGTPDTLDGIYEGAEGVSYSTSVGGFVSSSAVIFGHSVSGLSSVVDLTVYPYLFCEHEFGSDVIKLYFTAVPMRGKLNSNKTPEVNNMYSGADRAAATGSYNASTGVFSDISYVTSLSTGGAHPNYWEYASSYPIYSPDGSSLVFDATFTLPTSASGGWSWSDWETSTAALALTSYGDIVYQTFDYPLSGPSEEPSESPNPDTGTPDDSNNGLFAWLKMQWVFLLQKLQNINDSIKGLSGDINLYPEKTRPLLDDFFTNIFDNSVSSDDVVGLGGVLRNVRSWFDNGFKLGDLWALFEEEFMTSWFTEETRFAIDSTGRVADGS